MPEEDEMPALAPAGSAQAVIAEARGWRWVTVAAGAMPGGIELAVRGKLFAHVLTIWNGGAAVGLLLPEATAVRLIACGAAGGHPMIPCAGWVLIPLATAADVANAIGYAHEAYAHAAPKLALV